MIKFIKKIIEQYITCKHEEYTVIRKIFCGFDDYNKTPKWLERRKCLKCNREYYSDYFIEYGKERHYTKD